MAERRKKLMKVALPLEAIKRESAGEKAIRRGHPSTLHLWWARRPVAACRAVIFASRLELGGESATAGLLRRLGGLGETAREFACRLYTTSERKGWARDALAYSARVVAWPEIARRVAGTPESEAQQVLEI